jgi:uncharacterized protein
MPYDCQICGNCCRSIGKVIIGAIAALDEAEKSDTPIHPILEELASFPHDINPDGSCSKLSGDICTVYQSRPLICNTDKMHEKIWSSVMSRDDYYAQCQVSCQKLRDRRSNANNTDK